MRKNKQKKLDSLETENEITTQNDYNGEKKEPERQWDIITALCEVLELSNYSKLADHFWKESKSAIDYLTEKLDMTPMQIVILAILMEKGEAMSWRQIGEYLDCPRIKVMTYTEEVDGLLDKRWVVNHSVRQYGARYDGFALAYGVVTALRNNQLFIPEKLECDNIQELVNKMENFFEKSGGLEEADIRNLDRYFDQLCNANTHLPLCKAALSVDNDRHAMSLFLITVIDHTQWADSEGEGIDIGTIENFLITERYKDFVCGQLMAGTHILFEEGLLDYGCEDGMVNNCKYVISPKCKEELLSGFKPSRSKCPKNEKKSNNLRSHKKITAKNMYYNPEEQFHINRLTRMLGKNELPAIQKRLKEKGMRKGVACIFYGAPGTGKTETVLQIARQTGRDIMQVDIAGMRDKFVGETEKNIKRVFMQYRRECRNRRVIPILFFNEADALFTKRNGNAERSVDKMENAMQNIILQELEDLDGILIATTNLTASLDPAFERRFLVKVEFQKPSTEIRAKLWAEMFEGALSIEDATYLARRYDFSGGQIENIVRKNTIEYILTGENVSRQTLETFCEAELIARNSRKVVGFA